jgi:hypothetical protein
VTNSASKSVLLHVEHDSSSHDRSEFEHVHLVILPFVPHSLSFDWPSSTRIPILPEFFSVVVLQLLSLQHACVDPTPQRTQSQPHGTHSGFDDNIRL